MDKNNEKYKTYGTDEEVDLKEYLFYFLAHWKEFVISLGVCLVAAILYLYCVMPIYQVTATIMVRDEKRGGDFMTELSVFDGINALTNSNTDNEVEVLRSKTLIKNVIYTTQIYKDYLGKKTVKSVDLFSNSPIYLADSLFDVKNFKEAYLLNVEVESESEFRVRVTYKEEEIFDSIYTSCPMVIPTPDGPLELICNDFDDMMEYDEFEISITPPVQLARTYLKNLNIQTV